MKKGKTAVKSTSGAKVGAKKGYNYFFWILPFLILVFLFHISHCMAGSMHFMITNRREVFRIANL